MDTLKIRAIMEYEYRRGSNAAQVARNINNVYGANTTNQRTTFYWFARFGSRNFDMKNEPRGRPKTLVDNDELKAIVEANDTQSTAELAAAFEVTVKTILVHLRQIGKVKTIDKWVPHELNDRQREVRVEMCLALLNRHSLVNIPTFKLNNGLEMPALGYGTWIGVDDKLVFNIQDAPKLVEALSYAIDIGYRHIDTAHLYRVEPQIGQVVKRKITEGVVKREDLFITTKVWQHNHREADVEKSVRASLKRLDMDYVDLVLMHWPMAISIDGVDEKIDYLETYRGLEAVLQKVLTRAIGVSNFNLQQMKRLLANCNVVPVTNQIEINLNLGQKELVEYCQSKGVVVIAFTSFGTMVPSRAVPGSPEPKIDNPIMLAIAKKHGKTVTQVALRYLYQRDIVTIPKSLTKSRILENASIFDFELDEKDVAEIAKFDNGYRTDLPSFWQEYDNYPFDKISDPEKEIPFALLNWKNGANLDMD